jgi:Dna[CI] antecedent, DciA
MALQRAALSQVRRQLFGTSGERALVLLRAAWPGVVGPELARRTEVVSLDGTTLRVRVPDAGWQKVLHRMRGDILSRLFDVAGELAPRRLGFVEPPRLRGNADRASIVPGPASPIPDAVSLPSPPPTPQPAFTAGSETDLLTPPSVEAAAAAITDPELRRRFLASAARYLRARTP